MHTIKNIGMKAKHVFGASMIMFFLLSGVAAQTSKTDGFTPLALTPGLPAGSYPLSGFENVNLFNGSLNFHLPLFAAGGRGGATHVGMLAIEQHWRVTRFDTGGSTFQWASWGSVRRPHLRDAASFGACAGRLVRWCAGRWWC